MDTKNPNLRPLTLEDLEHFRAILLPLKTGSRTYDQLLSEYQRTDKAKFSPLFSEPFDNTLKYLAENEFVSFDGEYYIITKGGEELLDELREARTMSPEELREALTMLPPPQSNI